MSITISPSMNVQQIAELIEQQQAPNMWVYVRIESIQGKPIASLVREPVAELDWIPPVIALRSQQ